MNAAPNEISIDQQHRMVQMNLAQRFLDALRALDFVMDKTSSMEADLPDIARVNMLVMDTSSNEPTIRYALELEYSTEALSSQANAKIDEVFDSLNKMVDMIALQQAKKRQWLVSQTHRTEGKRLVIDVTMTMNKIEA